MSEVRLGRIRVTDQALEEREGNALLVQIPRDQIRGVQLRWGRTSEHPLLLWALAAVCFAVAIIGVVLIVRGVGFPKTAALSCALGVSIPWIVAAAVRQGPVLVVGTTRGTRRLGFGPGVSADRVPAFVEAARGATGLAIIGGA